MDRIVAYLDCFGMQRSRPVFFNLEIKAPIFYGYSNPVDNTSVTKVSGGGILRTASSSDAMYGKERSYSADNITPIEQYALKVGAQINIERRQLGAEEQRKKVGSAIEAAIDVALLFCPVGKTIKFASTVALHMAIAQVCNNNQWVTMAEIGRDECVEWLFKEFFTMVGVPEAHVLIDFSSASTGKIISTAQSASEAKMKRPLTPAESKMEQIHAFWQFADPGGYQRKFGSFKTN